MAGPTLMIVFLIFSLALLRFEQAPSCLECSGKFRHRPDCRSQR